MFARLSKPAPNLAALEGVETAVRARFRLKDDDLVIVSEDIGRRAGEPDRMTTILFWKNAERHRVRVFKPVADVRDADLPPLWVAGALRDDGGTECC